MKPTATTTSRSEARIAARAAQDERGRWLGPRHVRATGIVLPTYRRCEAEGCLVDASGLASACGERACPGCGTGGSTLVVVGSCVLCHTCQRTWSAEVHDS